MESKFLLPEQLLYIYRPLLSGSGEFGIHTDVLGLERASMVCLGLQYQFDQGHIMFALLSMGT